MKSVFFHFFMLLAVALNSPLVAQSYPQGLSEGNLMVDGRTVPVKLYATTDIQQFVDFPAKQIDSSILVVLNSVVNSYAQSGVFETYRAAGYQILDKNYNPISSESLASPETWVYLYKPRTIAQVLTPGKRVDLQTEFKVWNPSTGIKLGPITLHYYSLMFILAFGLGYVLMSRMFKIDNVNQKYLEPLFTLTLVGTILGARIGHVLFYQPELFSQDFWSVFLPIQTKPELKFTGFAGLASHGAAIALILTTLYYAFKIIKKNPLWVYDRIGIVVALAGVFIRLGNFFNSEIIGKPVDPSSPLAILFPQMSSEYGMTVPRYPTQLIEASGYLLLFVLLWVLYRYTTKKYQQGFLFGVFFAILWSIRFFVEYLKEPQGDEFISFAGLNTGQILSIPFIIIGLVAIVYSRKFKVTAAENEKPD